MKSLIMAAPGDATPMEPRWPGTNLPLAQPLPAGSTVATTVETRTEGLDLEAAGEYFAVAGKAMQQAQQLGIDVPEGIDFARAFSYVTAGAGIGAIGGPIGIGIGAAVGLITYAISWLQGNNGSTTYPNSLVANWAGAFAETAFVNWAVQNQVNGWASIEAIAQAQLLFWAEQRGVVIVAYRNASQVFWEQGVQQAKYYNNVLDLAYIGYAGGEAKVAELYKQVGVDYYKTRDARIAAGSVVQTTVAQYKARVTLAPGTADDTRNPDGSNSGTDSGISTGAILLGVGAVAAIALSSRQNN